MAGLSDILHNAVKIANTVTVTLQMTVKHAPVTRSSGVVTYNAAGEHSWDSAVSRKAIVENKQQLKRAADGTERMSRYQVTLLEAGVTVDLLDQFRFADDTLFPPILAIESVLDDAGLAYAHEIYF